jgi:hypothetical protein
MSYVNIQSWTSSSCILCAPHPPCGHDDSAYPYTRGYPRPTDLAKATRGSEPRRSRSCGGLFFTSWMVGVVAKDRLAFLASPPLSTRLLFPDSVPSVAHSIILGPATGLRPSPQRHSDSIILISTPGAISLHIASCGPRSIPSSPRSLPSACIATLMPRCAAIDH